MAQKLVICGFVASAIWLAGAVLLSGRRIDQLDGRQARSTLDTFKTKFADWAGRSWFEIEDFADDVQIGIENRRTTWNLEIDWAIGRSPAQSVDLQYEPQACLSESDS